MKESYYKYLVSSTQFKSINTKLAEEAQQHTPVVDVARLFSQYIVILYTSDVAIFNCCQDRLVRLSMC